MQLYDLDCASQFPNPTPLITGFLHERPTSDDARSLLGKVPFHPLLFAAFPILSLYAHNIDEVPLQAVWRPCRGGGYVPAPVRKRLYENITPVNSFRILLSTMFGADLPPLPDRSYFPVPGSPTHFSEVTNRLSKGRAFYSPHPRPLSRAFPPPRGHPHPAGTRGEGGFSGYSSAALIG